MIVTMRWDKWAMTIFTVKCEAMMFVQMNFKIYPHPQLVYRIPLVI